MPESAAPEPFRAVIATRVVCAAIGCDGLRRVGEVRSMSSMDPKWFNSESPFAAAKAQPADWERTNPFFVAPEAETNGETEYALVAQVPLTSTDELETFDDAILVTVAWGNNALLAKQVIAGETLVLGGDKSEFALPESIGFSHWPIIASRAGLGMCCIVPSNVNGFIEVDGRVLAMEQAKAERILGSSIEIPGAFELALRQGSHLRMELDNGLVVTVRSERAGRKPAAMAAGTLLASLADKYVALSLVAHLGILGIVGGVMPRMSGEDAESISRDDMLSMQHMLEASAEAEKERMQDQPESGGTKQNDTEAGGEAGQRAKDAEGALGAKSAPTKNARFAILKQNDGPLTLSRKEELELAREFGMASFVRTTATNAPTALWGTVENGRDDSSKNGKMFGATLEDANGAGGLHLEGTEEGGGGKAEGIGLTDIAGLGPGYGDRPGQGGLPGGNGGPGGNPGGTGDCLPGQICGSNSHRPSQIGHKPQQLKPPSIVFTPAGGHIPAEAIQRVVRMNFGRFRQCYEAGLRADPSLRGRVVTRFVIARDGSVAMASDGGSDIPNSTVAACVVRSFQGLSFPTPDNGTVNVTYPLTFTPGE